MNMRIEEKSRDLSISRACAFVSYPAAATALEGPA